MSDGRMTPDRAAIPPGITLDVLLDLLGDLPATVIDLPVRVLSDVEGGGYGNITEIRVDADFITVVVVTGPYRAPHRLKAGGDWDETGDYRG
jgi:hypothetical protein